MKREAYDVLQWLLDGVNASFVNGEGSGGLCMTPLYGLISKSRSEATGSAVGFSVIRTGSFSRHCYVYND